MFQLWAKLAGRLARNSLRNAWLDNINEICGLCIMIIKKQNSSTNPPHPHPRAWRGSSAWPCRPPSRSRNPARGAHSASSTSTPRPGLVGGRMCPSTTGSGSFTSACACGADSGSIISWITKLGEARSMCTQRRWPAGHTGCAAPARRNRSRHRADPHGLADAAGVARVGLQQAGAAVSRGSRGSPSAETGARRWRSGSLCACATGAMAAGFSAWHGSSMNNGVIRLEALAILNRHLRREPAMQIEQDVDVIAHRLAHRLETGLGLLELSWGRPACW